MKELTNKIISNLHFLILIYGLYGGWVLYDEHIIQLVDVVSRESGMSGEIEIAQRKIKEIIEYSKKTDELKVRVEEVAKNTESVQKQLPSETNDTNILSYFRTEINALNIKDANFTPGKEVKGTYYISKGYNLKARGTFLQFLIFFERIGTSDRIYNIVNLKLTTPSDYQKGRFQMISGEGVIEAFRYNPEFKVERGL